MMTNGGALDKAQTIIIREAATLVGFGRSLHQKNGCENAFREDDWGTTAKTNASVATSATSGSSISTVLPCEL